MGPQIDLSLILQDCQQRGSSSSLLSLKKPVYPDVKVKNHQTPLNPLHRAFTVDVFLFLGTAYSRYLSFYCLLFGPFFQVLFFKCCPAFLKGNLSLICQIKPTTAEGSQTGTQTNLPANRHNESEATRQLDTGEIFISYTCKWRVNKFTVSSLQSF